MNKLITIILLALSIMSCQNNTSKEVQTEETLEVEHEKVELVSPNTKENDSQINELKKQYNHLRAKFIGTDEGDLFYYNFEDEQGNEYSFSLVKDESYELLIDDESSMYGLSIKPTYKNKYFDIFFQTEEHDLLDWGENQAYEVVRKMILVEE
jgi:hypothetical protein